MRCLTVRQPHAWGLIFGSKRIENRSRRTHHRGPLAIHAGRTTTELSEAIRAQYPGLPPIEELAFGAVIGVVDVIGCVPIEEVATEPYAEGPWCWITANPRPVEPFPWPGSLGFFEIDDDRLTSLVK